MAQNGTPHRVGASALEIAAWVASATAIVGVFSTWTSDGPVSLNGVQGPNNGWLVIIVAGFALVCTRFMGRGSWVGVAGVLGASLVMGRTAIHDWLDGREVAGATASYGLLLVIAASSALACTALVRGVRVARDRRRT